MSVKLSIIIPTFNRAGMLREALDSILEQSSSSIEIVVADDASTDDSLAVCEEFKARALSKGMEFLVIQSDINKGAPFLRNEGFRQSSGEVVMFMDSDDVLEPDVVRQLLPEFSDPSIEFIYGKVRLTDESLHPLPGETIGSPYNRGGRDIGGYHWQTMGAIYRRKLIEMVDPWQEKLTGSQDWEFQARVKIVATNWKFLEIFIGGWRQHHGTRVGTTRFRLDYVQSVGKACMMIHDAAERAWVLNQGLKTRLAQKLIVHAAELGAHGYAEDQKLFFSRAFDLLPKNPLTYVCGRLCHHMPSCGSRLALAGFAFIRQMRSPVRISYPVEKECPTALLSKLTDIKTSVMITSKNRSGDLLRTCRVLQKLNPPPFEVLITADGCADDTVEAVRAQFPEAILIINEVGQGSVASRDRMMREARGDLVFSLDDDSYPEQLDCIARIAPCFENNPRLAVLHFPQRTDEYPASLEQTDFGPERLARSFANSGAVLRRDVYLRLPGYEMGFFHMYEEPDYALQCVAAGLDILMSSVITIRHHYSIMVRSELRNHHRHARNELWSTVMRCPFPYSLGIIGYRILSQARYAAKRGMSWLIREPWWWGSALKGIPQALRRRHPVSWEGYRRWLSMPDS